MTWQKLKQLGKNLMGVVRCGSQGSYPVKIRSRERPAKGTVLFSYLDDPLLWPDDAPEFSMHSNLWESREIARIFTVLGYDVESIYWGNNRFVPSKEYAIVFDICHNLARLSPVLGKDTIKILHCTGSDPFYQNEAEQKRVDAVNLRRNGQYVSKRAVKDPELFRRSMIQADACSLIGNETTLRTYPEEFHGKTTLVPVSASDLGPNVKQPQLFVPAKREFLWFAGGGAVHKGLDLVLEVFAKNRDLTLNVVGNVAVEEDFLAMYRRELMELENIRYHGALEPAGATFATILKDSFCFIAPFCSESISTAVATCLQAGLYPIISRDTGATLPRGCGIYLDTCEISEIEEAVRTVTNMQAGLLREQIGRIQLDALESYSRVNFSRSMVSFLRQTLNKNVQLDN